jgi:hypothetical protein
MEPGRLLLAVIIAICCVRVDGGPVVNGIEVSAFWWYASCVAATICGLFYMILGAVSGRFYRLCFCCWHWHSWYEEKRDSYYYVYAWESDYTAGVILFSSSYIREESAPIAYIKLSLWEGIWWFVNGAVLVSTCWVNQWITQMFTAMAWVNIIGYRWVMLPVMISYGSEVVCWNLVWIPFLTIMMYWRAFTFYLMDDLFSAQVIGWQTLIFVILTILSAIRACCRAGDPDVCQARQEYRRLRSSLQKEGKAEAFEKFGVRGLYNTVQTAGIFTSASMN